MGILARAKAGWTASGDDGAEDTKTKCEALPSALLEAYGRPQGSGCRYQGWSAVYRRGGVVSGTSEERMEGGGTGSGAGGGGDKVGQD